MKTSNLFRSVKRYVLGVMLSMALILQTCVPVMATEVSEVPEPTEEAETQDISLDTTTTSKTGTTLVEYNGVASQTFTTTIPKKIVIGSDKTVSYNITVKGDVALGSTVDVTPHDDVPDVEGDDTTTGVNFVMKVAAGKVGAPVNVTVTADDTNWDYTAITTKDGDTLVGTTKSGVISGPGLTKGVWSGTLTFDVNFNDEYAEPTAGEEEMVQVDNPDWEATLMPTENLVVLSKYKGTATTVEVPATLEVNGTSYTTALQGAPSTLIPRDKGITSVSFASGINMSHVTSASNLFQNCTSLETVDLTNFDFSNVTSMDSMFNGCTALTTVNLTGANTAKVENMSNMFEGCTTLATLDLSSFDASSVVAANRMFYGCTNLTTIYANESKWVPSSAESTEMYDGCGTSTVTAKPESPIA